MKLTRNPRSVKLTSEEIELLQKFREGFDTEVAAADELGVDRLVLNRILLVGSGSFEKVTKIRKVLKRLQAA